MQDEQRDVQSPEITPGGETQKKSFPWVVILSVVIAISIITNLFQVIWINVGSDLDTDDVIVLDEDLEEITLATAINLLPEPEYAIAGQQLSDHLYWVWVQKPVENLNVSSYAYRTIDESWTVNIATGECYQIYSYEFGVPYGPSASHQEQSDEYFSTLWKAGWEGTSEEVNEYIERETGEYSFSLDLLNSDTAKIMTTNDELQIKLSPTNVCDNLTYEESLNDVVINGLDVNGELLAFDEPVIAKCTFNDMANKAYIHPFDYLVFSESDIKIRLGLNLGDYRKAEIPLGNLTKNAIIIE